MHVAVFHIPVFRFRSVHRTDGAEHTGDFSAFQILRRHKPCLRTPESAGTIPLAAGKSQLKNRSPDTAVLRRRRRKLCCAAGSDSVSCSFCGIPPQSGFPPLHPFLNETLSRQSRPRILKKQKEHSAISVQKTALQEQLYINSEYPETEYCFRKERNHQSWMHGSCKSFSSWDSACSDSLLYWSFF